MPAAPTINDKIEADLAKSGLDKLKAQKKVTAREQKAIRDLERKREETLRWQYYETIPQKHWRMMSGRQAKVFLEQAERYGIPFSGKTINLPAVVRALHDFLAANKYKLAAAGNEDPLLVGEGDSPGLERFRLARAAQEEIRLATMRRDTVDRETMHKVLLRGMLIVRQSVETLQRQYGDDAARIVNEGLQEAERVLDSISVDDNSDPRSSTGN